MKFKTYQSCIGIFIVCIVAIVLYVFLEDDSHKKLVLYCTFSVVAVWSMILINHRMKVKQNIRKKTKQCILEDLEGEYCSKVKQKIADYAMAVGRSYEDVFMQLQNQIIAKTQGLKRNEYYHPENEHLNDNQIVDYKEELPLEATQTAETPVEVSVDYITTKKLEESNEITKFINLMQTDIIGAYNYAADLLHDTYMNDKVKSELCKRLEDIIGDSKHRDEYLKMISDYAMTFNKSFDESAAVMRNNITASLMDNSSNIRKQLDRLADYNVDMNDHDYILKKMLECVSDTATNGRICKEVATMVNLYASQEGKTYEEMSQMFKKEAFDAMTKKTGGSGEPQYGQFDVIQYGEF